MPVNPPQNTVFDGFLELSGGVNSGSVPQLIPNNTLAFAWNATVRGGYVSPRPGIANLPFDFSQEPAAQTRLLTGRFQGAELYTPDIGAPYHVVSVSGRLFKVAIGSDSAPVTEITIRHQVTTTADFVVPAVGATVVVSVDATANISVGVTVSVGAGSFTVTAVDSGALTITLQNVDSTVGSTIVSGTAVIFFDVNPATRKQVWMCQAEKWLIIQDGQSVPIIWDGAQARRSVATLGQIQAGKMMAYHLGRVAKVNPDGKTFSIGDLVYSGTSGTAGEQHRDAVLYVKENTFLQGGGFFTVPGTYGEITFMKGVSILDSSLGQGPLQIGTERAIFSCNLPVDRTTWQNLENPILTVSNIASGGASQESAALANGDLFYRSLDTSIRSLILGIREFTTSWGNVPVSREMNRILLNDDQTLLPYATGVVHDNRLLMSTSPVFSNRGIYHRGMAVLDFDVMSSMRDKKPACWDGLWLGINLLRLIVGHFDKQERCFAFALTSGSQLQLWEVSRSDTKDNGTLPIHWAFETASFLRKGPNFHELDLKRLLNAELHISDVRGRVDIWVYFRPDQHACWIPWNHLFVCSNEDQCVQSDDGCITNNQLSPQFRNRLSVGQPPDTCDSATNIPYRMGNSFQLRVELLGYCKVTGARVMATLVPEPTFGKMQNTCVDDSCYSGSTAVVEYKNAPQSYTATCPAETPIGDPVSVTIPSGAFVSSVSQAAADALALAAAQAQAEAALVCATTFDVTVTVAAGTVGSDLADFPLLIRLSDMPAKFWNYVASDGSDIRAYDSGGTQIPIDMAWIDTGTNDGVIWVKQTISNSTATEVTIKCGNGAAALAPTDPNGRNAVWSDYERVYLFRSDLVDRTGNANATVSAGSASYNLSSIGNLGAGGGLVGNNSNRFTCGTPSGSTIFTLGVSFEFDGWSGGSSEYVMSYRNTGSSERAIGGFLSVATSTFGLYDSTNGLNDSGVTPTLNTGYRLNTVWNGTTARRLYINGSQSDFDLAITAVLSGGNSLTIMSDGPTGTSLFDGTVAYLYLRLDALSADWIAAEYANVNSPSTFYSVTGP